MTFDGIFSGLVAWLSGLRPHTRVLLGLATTIFLAELAFRRFAPRSRAYAKWTAFFHEVGAVWTAVILSIVYFVSVALVSLGMKLARKDPLGRHIGNEPTFWHPHQPNPLGARAAARHQF